MINLSVNIIIELNACVSKLIASTSLSAVKKKRLSVYCEEEMRFSLRL